MPNLSGLTTIKNNFMELVLSDPKLVALITNSTDITPADSSEILACSDVGDLRYTQVIPYQFVPDTASEQKTYVFFETEVPVVKTTAVLDVYLYVYVVTHKDLMRIPGKGIRVDLICHRIDQLLNGDTEWGFERVELQSVRELNPAHDFRGKYMIYKIEDWNRFCGDL